MHTRFVARCPKHLKTTPKIRSVYGLVYASTQEPAVTEHCKWFSDIPRRTHRLRPTLPDEREQYPHSGELMLVRKLAHGETDRIAIYISDHEKLASDDDFLRGLFDQGRKAGPRKCIFTKLPGGAA